MWIVNFPASCPCGFWAAALIWSLFQAYAGYRYGLYIYDNAGYENGSHSKPTRLLAYGVHHGIFYFACSFSGFATWRLAHWVSSAIGNWADVASGTAAIVIALTVLSIAGISGGLPRIIFFGKLPWK